MGIIRGILELYIYVIIAATIISYVPSLQDNGAAKVIKQITHPLLAKIRKFLPPDLPLDFSPFIAMGLILIIKLLW